MKDVFAVGWTGSSSGKSKGNGNFSRKLKTTSRVVTVKNLTTGKKLSGEIGPGNFSKKEMRRLTDAMIKKLKKELCSK